MDFETALARRLPCWPACASRNRLRVLHASAHRSPGWNTMLRDGRWVPTSRRRNTSSTKANMPRGGGSQTRRQSARRRRSMCGRSIASRCRGRASPLVDDDYQLDDTPVVTRSTPGPPLAIAASISARVAQHAIVVGDLMHHALQCREPDWSTVFDGIPSRPRSRGENFKRHRRHRQVGCRSIFRCDHGLIEATASVFTTNSCANADSYWSQVRLSEVRVMLFSRRLGRRRPERPSDLAERRQSFWPWMAQYEASGVCRHIYSPAPGAARSPSST